MGGPRHLPSQKKKTTEERKRKGKKGKDPSSSRWGEKRFEKRMGETTFSLCRGRKKKEYLPENLKPLKGGGLLPMSGKKKPRKNPTRIRGEAGKGGTFASQERDSEEEILLENEGGRRDALQQPLLHQR